MRKGPHHWRTRHHGHMASHGHPHARRWPHRHHSRRGGPHHARVRRWDHRPSQWRSRKQVGRNSPLLKRSSRFINQALGLLFHPFLIIVSHVLFVLPSTAVCLPHRWRIMGKIRITVITVELGHDFPRWCLVPRYLQNTLDELLFLFTFIS